MKIGINIKENPKNNQNNIKRIINILFTTVDKEVSGRVPGADVNLEIKKLKHLLSKCP